jgi:hypothetical protein
MQGFGRAQILDHATDAVRDSYEPTNDSKAQAKKEFNRRMWDIGDRQIDERIKVARDLIDEQGKADNEAFFNLFDAQYADLYMQLYKIQDFKACTAVVDKRVKLRGLERTPAALDPAALAAQAAQAGAAAGAAAAMTVDEWKALADDRRAQTMAEVSKALEKANGT